MKKKRGIPYNYLVNRLVSLTVNTKRAVKFPVIAIAQYQVKLGKERCSFQCVVLTLMSVHIHGHLELNRLSTLSCFTLVG